ncbi:MAG TPA: ATPase, T2SS/T4P/T4SS family [Gammaproteobacteria bacterium]|nr:ATPase, T2SS/T4P/T4SS family [Gammaproteobacteria bacterium]
MMKTTYASQSELDPKDRPMVEMQEWCERQGDIVVLKSGLILTSDIYSRSVQNCKAILQQKFFKTGKVVEASQQLIDLLLADSRAVVAARASKDQSEVSVQQQRLRILVKEALQLQVSDIHIEVREDVAHIRFRKHGELFLYAEWQSKLGREIASVAFNKETDHAISHFNPSVPQNASMPLHIDGVDVRLRLASMPAHGGFDMVMRLLSTGHEKIKALEELGYLPEQIDMIKRAVAMPNGAVVISGPTGSGKTTTLASCMQLVARDRKIYTIEDPVEKIITNATQIPVNTEKTDRDFASMGRAALRMDPDVMVLGEIRDEGTARVMTRAAITGHVVFSTLHTNSATAIIPRLIDMGISANLLSDPNLLVCLICQRLIPILCENCAKTLPNGMRARGTVKCTTCQGIGIQERKVIAEIIWIDDKAREFIQNCDILGWEKSLRAEGWKSYRDRAIEMAKAGRVDPKDVEKLTGSTINLF